VGQGFRAAAGLLAGVSRFGHMSAFTVCGRLFAIGDAERKLGGRAEALPHRAA
jgi:hypothetical protein